MEKLAQGYGLIEGPVWDPARGLIYTDVINGGAYCLDENGAISTVIEHRRGMGGMSLHENGGLVVSGRNISLKPADGGPTQLIFAGDPDAGEIGFNDITTDGVGRVYAGSLTFRPVGSEDTPTPGRLYCIDLDGSARIVGEDVMLTNGLGFSPDGKTLYHSESRRDRVRAYDVAEDGSLSPERTFAAVTQGTPDGLVVAEDGSVWVACARGGCVAVFDADGSEREPIPVELPMVTSVCFGGADLRDLYIVTGSEGAGEENAGAIYRMRVDVPGLPVPLARVAVD
jgi:gluconolactonase